MFWQETATPWDDVAVIALVGVLLFLACREIVLWYFLIRRRMSLQESNNELLLEIRNLLKAQSKPEIQPKPERELVSSKFD